MPLTDYDLETLTVARHEAAHAAAAVGFPVHAVDLAHGHTDIAFPLRPWQLYSAWERAPHQTERQLVAIVGVILAPAHITREPMPARCGDAAMLQEWREEWQRVCAFHPQGHASHGPTGGHDLPLPPLPWHSVCQRAQAAINTWITAPGARAALRYLAAALTQEGAVDAVGWALLWEKPQYDPLRSQGGRENFRHTGQYH